MTYEHSVRMRAYISIDYENIVRRGAAVEIGEILKRWVHPDRNIVIVGDDTVSDLYYETIRQSLIEGGWKNVTNINFASGEKSKDLSTFSILTDKLIEAGAHRRSVLLALGGGVTCDTVGFVASSYMRGVDYINIPTSMMAQVDAGIGGKVAINHKRAKNLIGGFHHPLAVIIDPNFLQTLSKIDFLNGLAEAIKVAIIGDHKLFELLESYTDELADFRAPDTVIDKIILRAIQIKIDLLLPDPFETDLRRLLNFGHTFAHPIEVASNYKILHGHAVAIGMSIATRIAANRKKISKNCANRIIHLLSEIGLPTQLEGIDADILWDHHLNLVRSVRAGKLNYVIPTRIGKATIIEDISYNEFLDSTAQHQQTKNATLNKPFLKTNPFPPPLRCS